MATKKAKTQKETAASTKKNGAAPVTTDLCAEIKTALLEQVQKAADETFGKGKVAFAEGSAYSNHANGEYPGYGDVTLTFELPKEFESKMKGIFAAVGKAHGVALTKDPKRVNRATFEFATMVDGKLSDRNVVNWNTWAGHKPEDEDDFDFSMLEKEWLDQSFLFDDGEGCGLQWYTVAGLNQQANKPVVTVCSDPRWAQENEGSTFSFEADKLAEIIASQPKLKPSDEVKKARPAGAKVAGAAPRPTVAVKKAANGSKKVA
jgi:hypothetical protein